MNIIVALIIITYVVLMNACESILFKYTINAVNYSLHKCVSYNSI